MKKLLFLLLLIPFLGTSQGTFTAPVGYNTGAPTAAPSGVGTRWRFDLLTGKKYTWNPDAVAWDEDPRGIDQISGCSAPMYTPTARQSVFAVNSCTALQNGRGPELYYYTGSAWLQINEGQTYEAGSGIDITDGVISSTATGGPDSSFVNTDGTYTGKRITDTIERTAPLISPIWDKGGFEYNVAAYGIFPDGTDQTAKIQALLDTVYNHGGGRIVFGSGTYRINGKLKPKTNYNGSNVPQTPNMVIQGTAGFQSGNGQKPIGGTILDMRWEGDTIGCLQLRGTGLVEIKNITFEKKSSGLPNTFIHTTLATLHIHDCGFVGYGTSSRNRAIVLGGNYATPALPDTSAEAGFQGYGTVIENNYFNWISTGVMLQTYANAVIISNNNFWNACGGFAAIWLACKNDTNTGNVIENNLIEMNNYTYGIYLGANSVSNTIKGNNFYDGPSGSKNIKSIATNANTIIEGFNGSGIPYTGNRDINTILSMQSNDTTNFVSNIMLKTGNFFALRGGLGERIYGTGNKWLQTSYGTISGVETAIWRWNNGTSSKNEVIQMSDFNPLIRFQLRADATDEFGEYTSSGNMRMYCKTGGEFWIGTGGNLNHLFLGGTLYGGLTSTNTPFKIGQSDKIMWADASSPTAGDGAGLSSTAINVLRTLNAAGTDGRHQAADFYATGTGANQLPSGTSSQRPSSPAAGMTRFCTNCTATDGSTGVVETYNGSTWKNAW